MANDHIADDRKKVRLIDANAYPCQTCEVSYCYKNCKKFNEWLNKTVDAVEVVHGRWEPDTEVFDADPTVGIPGGVFQTGWKCSVCGRSEPCKEPYCNCGAIMDGERRTNEPEEPV